MEKVAELISQWEEDCTCNSTAEEPMDTTQYEEAIGNFGGNNLTLLRLYYSLHLTCLDCLSIRTLGDW